MRAGSQPGAVGLPECIEDDAVLLRRDSNTGIPDGKCQGDRLGRGRFLLAADRHLAAACKLDGIRNEIEQDLPQAHNVALKGVGDLIIDLQH